MILGMGYFGVGLAIAILADLLDGQEKRWGARLRDALLIPVIWPLFVYGIVKIGMTGHLVAPCEHGIAHDAHCNICDKENPND